MQTPTRKHTPTRTRQHTNMLKPARKRSHANTHINTPRKHPHANTRIHANIRTRPPKHILTHTRPTQTHTYTYKHTDIANITSRYCCITKGYFLVKYHKCNMRYITELFCDISRSNITEITEQCNKTLRPSVFPSKYFTLKMYISPLKDLH